jgi:thiol-disulfide isomerase/thioredoxin
MKYLVMMAISVSLASWGKAYDLEPLTYDTNLWTQDRQYLLTQFPELKWQNTSDVPASSLEGLELWGQRVDSISIVAKENGTTTQLGFSLISKENLESLEGEEFTLVSNQWKQLLDKKLNSSGVRRPIQVQGEQKISKIAWKSNSSVIVLTAIRDKVPRALQMDIFETQAGLASLEPVKNSPAEAPAKAPADSTILNQLKGATSFVKRSNFEKVDITGNPDYFLLYFSASWCGPCRASVPELVKYYKQTIQKNKKVELLHMSQDNDPAAALSWAVKEKFPWPTVLYHDQQTSKLTKYASRGIPHYVLIDKDGNVIAKGQSDCDKKIKSL